MCEPSPLDHYSYKLYIRRIRRKSGKLYIGRHEVSREGSKSLYRFHHRGHFQTQMWCTYLLKNLPKWNIVQRLVLSRSNSRLPPPSERWIRIKNVPAQEKMRFCFSAAPEFSSCEKERTHSWRQFWKLMNERRCVRISHAFFTIVDERFFRSTNSKKLMSGQVKRLNLRPRATGYLK